MNYITGETIKNVWGKRGITQKKLADMINLGDKTISKWGTNNGNRMLIKKKFLKKS